MTDEQQFLRKILYNPFLRQKFKNFDENKKYFSYYDKEEYIEKLQKIMMNEIQRMNEVTFDIELITSWFECILQDVYFEDVYLLFHNDLNQALIQKAKALGVDIEFYTNYVSRCFEQLEISNKYEQCLNKYLNYRKENYMIDAEFERYVFALNMKDDNLEDNFAYIFNMILDKRYQLSTIEYQKFFYRFCHFAAKEFGLENAKINFNQNLECAGKHSIETSKDGKRAHRIRMRTKDIILKNILGNLQVLFHEIKHGVQSEEVTELYRLDNIKQLEDTILRKILGNNFYEINYRYISSEADAEVCSYILLGKILQVFAPLTYRQEKDNLDVALQNTFALEQNSRRKLSYKDEYDLQTLFTTVLKNNLDTFYNDLSEEEKNVILQVYNKDGSPKTTDYYFEQKTLLLNQLQTVVISDSEKLHDIEKQINFYDAILLSFSYNLADLKRNYLALEKYQSSNPDINAEVLQYKNNVINQLLEYGEGQVVFNATIERPVIK